jgi:hypothetical protein
VSAKRPFLRGWRRVVAIVLATAPIGVLVFVLIFVARTELAFDEERCPYVEGELRSVAAGVAIREDARVCQEDVEERRWVLLRERQPPLELGRRRLGTELWGEGYTWSAHVDDEGRVRVEIQNPSQPPRLFREPAADAGA